MPLAANLKRFLNRYGIQYRLLHHDRTNTLEETAEVVEVDKTQIIKAWILGDGEGYVMVVLPLFTKIDYFKLKRKLYRSLQLLPRKEINKLFYDCEPGSYPPIGEIYNLEWVLDESLYQLKYVYFESGCHSVLVQISMEDFLFLSNGAHYSSFADQDAIRINKHPERTVLSLTT